MAATIGIIGGAAGLFSIGSGIANLTSGGTSNSGGTPNTATGGQSANLLSSAQMGQAGSQYLNDASALQGYGQGYASQFFPQVESATQNAANNPYGSQAIQGSQAAASYGSNSLAPSQAAGSSQLSSLAALLSQYGQGALAQSSTPTAGAGYEGQYLSQAATPTPGAAYQGQALQQAFGAPVAGSQYTNAALQQAFAPTAGGQMAGQALATGFAPNNGLYNQQLQQTQDQSNAINAMYGLGSSPYGANLTDQATQNFNNQFNLNQANLQSQAANTYNGLMNQQLATQGQGLSAFGDLTNANLANQAQGLNAYTGLQNTQLANQTGNLNAYNSLSATDLASQLGLAGLGSTLGGQSGSLLGQGSTLGQGALTTLGTASAAPASTYQGLANNSLAQLGVGAQNANATLSPYTTYLNSLGNILGLGQVGQANAASQAQTGFNQQQAVGSNLGQSLSALGGTGSGSLQSLWNAINGTGSSTSSDPYSDSYSDPLGAY